MTRFPGIPALLLLAAALIPGLSSCRQTFLAVEEPLWESYLSVSSSGPDWKELLSGHSFRTVSVPLPAGDEGWKAVLEKYSPAGVFFPPLLFREAAGFAASGAGIPVLTAGPELPAGEIPQGMTLLAAERTEAYEALGRMLAERLAGGEPASAVFAAGSDARLREREAFLRGWEAGGGGNLHEFTVSSGRDAGAARDFLAGELTLRTGAAVLSAGSLNGDLYGILENRNLLLFLEEAGGEKIGDPRIFGFFHPLWEKKFKEVLAVSPETWETIYRVPVEFLLRGGN